MSRDLGSPGLIQNNCSLNTFTQLIIALQEMDRGFPTGFLDGWCSILCLVVIPRIWIVSPLSRVSSSKVPCSILILVSGSYEEEQSSTVMAQ